MPLSQQLASKIRLGPGGHWLWTAYARKYGRVMWRGRVWQAHRAIWTELHGPIPKGCELHHVCKNKLCVRPHPDHVALRNISEHRKQHQAERRASLTHCPNGHEMTPENVYIEHVGQMDVRRCRVCMAERHQKYRRANLEKFREYSRRYKQKQLKGLK